MSLYDSFIDLVDRVGWPGDFVLLVIGFLWAVYWFISIAGWGLATALWIKTFSWIRDWFSRHRRKP